MSERQRRPSTKKPGGYYWPAVGSLLVGTGVAGVVAAQAIAAAAGHHVPARPLVGNLYSPIDGLRWLALLNKKCILGPHVASVLNPAHLRANVNCATPTAFILSVDERFAAWFGGGLASFTWFKIAAARAKTEKARGRVFHAVHSIAGQPTPFVIELGKATGKLRDLGHEAGIAKDQRVRLVDDDVSQDTIIFGGKGSGKTTRAMNPILLQALKNNCGALVFNVKGDYDHTVLALAYKAGRKVRIIGVGEGAERFDLLAGVTPEMASTYISSLLLLTGNTARESTFWNTNAANLSRAVLGLLSYMPAHYSLPGLYRYLFVEDYRTRIDGMIADWCDRAEIARTSATSEQLGAIERELRYIYGCRQEIATFWKQTHDIKSGVQSQLSQILAKMVQPEIEDAFGRPQEADAEALSLEQLYTDGTVLIVNVPLQTYGLAAAAIMCFIKLRFYVTMEQRRLRKDLDQTRRVGLFIDECHEIAACSQEGMSDHKFFAISRDTRTFCVLATQSVYSLIAKVGDDMTRALLANLRQRLYFRTEDRWTIEDALFLLGLTEVNRESTSTNRNPGAWFASRGTSNQPQMQPIADPSLIRNLEVGEALAVLSIGGVSADDVITTFPEYAGAVRS